MTYATTADITARYPGVLADSAPRDSNGALDAALARLDRIASGREELIGLAPPATGAAGGQVRVAVPTAYGHVFKPKTRARSSGVKLAFASCLQMAGKELTGLYQMLAADVHALLTQGDWPYPADEAGWGIARDNTAWNDPAALPSSRRCTAGAVSGR